MKSIRNILYSVLVLSFFATYISCGGSDKKSEVVKSEEVESEEGSYRSYNGDYRKACTNRDWDNAYKIVDGLNKLAQGELVEYEYNNAKGGLWEAETAEHKAKYESAKESYEEALRYVVLQEAMVTLEESGENGIMRIVAIAKEHEAEDWLYKEMLDVAKKIGDDGLADRFQKIINNNK